MKPSTIQPGELQPLVDTIIQKAQTYLKEEVATPIQQAYMYAFKAHQGQMRFSGEPYITHPLAATTILMDLKPDLPTIIACILHDIPENTSYTIDDIDEHFGVEVATLVQGIIDMSTLRYQSKKEMEILKQLGLALIKDIRIVFIKFSERLHNIQTLHHVPSEEKRKRIAEESLYVYAPIANRLGLLHLKGELEEACFQFLHPTEYLRISTYLHSSDNLRQELLDEATHRLTSTLHTQGIQAEVKVRRKAPYSIYAKMKRKGTSDITEIKDLLAARIIVLGRGQCYNVLGFIHQHWIPITSRIKDYIAKPKPNNYQSIHTVIKGIFDDYPLQTLEVQIRSRKMHEEAEYGNSAHAMYKEKGSNTLLRQQPWMQRLHQRQGNTMTFFEEQTFVLTPSGEIIPLPKRATPVDFAYTVSATMGDTCIAAKVNGHRVSLDYQLKTGETVEIITSQEPNPNPTWLSFVVTKEARTQIKTYLQSQDKEELIREGQFLLNEYLKKHHLPLLSKDMSILHLFLEGKSNTTQHRKEILMKLTTQELPLGDAIKRIKQHYLRLKEVPTTTPKAAIVIDGERDIPYKVAQCCNPSPPHPLMGYATRGKYISIHSASCHLLRTLDGSRFLPAQWDPTEHHTKKK